MSTTQGDQGPGNRSRKQRRDEAREQRKAAEAAEAAAAARRRRLMQLGGVAVAVIVVIVVIVVATGGKSSPSEEPAAKTPSAENAARKTVSSELEGIPQEGVVLGKPNAPVTIQYFGDLECPICRDFTLGALPNIIAKQVRSGKAKIEYRSLSTATGTAEAEGKEPRGIFATQQVAAYAAGKQNLGWNYIELFYHEQAEEGSGYVTERFLENLAAQVPGLDLSEWSAARAEKALETQVYEDEKAGNKAGFEGTPSFLIGKTGGKLTSYSPPSDVESQPFEEVIEKYATS